ncbi:MAG: PQQ-binding-like beta-propeller repeat protein [Candidatus Bathyarchaeia archaeon]|jgi:hypothetical protein
MQINNFLAKRLSVASLILLLIASAALTLNPSANAAAGDTQVAGELPSGVTPSITITTKAFLGVSPDPIGINQPILVNMWLHPPILVARQFVGAFTLSIEKPDGETEVIDGIDSYAGDSTAWLEYSPDQLGTYRFKFDFIGQYFPQISVAGGGFVSGGTYNSAYYKPSTSGWVNLTVQEEMVYSWQQLPAPTDYWTRPISPNTREWWSIGGSFPPTGIVGGTDWPEDTNKYMSNYNFIPYVQGPESGHVLWRKQFALGGLTGGPGGQAALSIGGGLTGAGFPTIVYQGRCYESYTKPGATAGVTNVNYTYWKCYDLRTGEVYWDMPVAQSSTGSALVPNMVEYHKQGFEVAGATARAGYNVYLTLIQSGSGNTDGRILKWDPYTGALSINLTGPPSSFGSTNVYGYPWVLSVQNLGASIPASQRYRLINWSIENNAGNWVAAGGGSVANENNFTKRIYGNISWPFSNLGTVQDFESMIAVSIGSQSANGTGTAVAQTLTGASMITGQTLWTTQTDNSTGLETFFSSGISVADHGKLACRMQDGPIRCWDLQTGKVLWDSELSAYPWGVFGAYHVQSAYGFYYTADYDGVHAVNWTNGNIEWTFNAQAVPFETPYNEQYAFHSSAKVADDKYYTVVSEHTPTQPLTRGCMLYCLDAHTGKQLWNVSNFQGIPGSRTFQGAIADGYLALTNEYDGYTYIYGKGPSKTTISAPQTAVTLGQSIEITGTVLDQSPGSMDTPAIADENMGDWMGYLYTNSPKPTNAIGVPVSLDAYDPNGNYIHIADVISNVDGSFQKLWQPENAGEYTIIATFMGTNSYGSSSASTGIGVVNAPESTATPQTSEIMQAPITTFDAAILIAVIIAILIGIINLRKR